MGPVPLWIVNSNCTMSLCWGNFLVAVSNCRNPVLKVVLCWARGHPCLRVWRLRVVPYFLIHLLHISRTICPTQYSVSM